jgi:hypothetical protein
VSSENKTDGWAVGRKRLDAELLTRAETIYAKLAALAEGGDLKAMQLFFKELADAESRIASLSPTDGDVEIIYEVVPPNQKNKGRRPKDKS